MDLTDAERSLLDFEREWWQLPTTKLLQTRPGSASRRAATTGCSICWSTDPMLRPTTRSPSAVYGGGVSKSGESASRAAAPIPGAGEAPSRPERAE